MRHQAYLMLHAAALERGGHGLLLPASPGHGKTTLCAALAHRGWRFLSDEFGLVRQHAIEVLPIPRPMPLKNESIDVMRSFAPDAWLGPSIPGTRKGTVAHVRPPSESIRASERPASVRWIVFPRWEAGAGLTLEPVSKAQAFLELALGVARGDGPRAPQAVAHDFGAHAASASYWLQLRDGGSETRFRLFAAGSAAPQSEIVEAAGKCR